MMLKPLTPSPSPLRSSGARGANDLLLRMLRVPLDGRVAVMLVYRAMLTPKIDFHPLNNDNTKPLRTAHQ